MGCFRWFLFFVSYGMYGEIHIYYMYIVLYLAVCLFFLVITRRTNVSLFSKSQVEIDFFSRSSFLVTI